MGFSEKAQAKQGEIKRERGFLANKAMQVNYHTVYMMVSVNKKYRNHFINFDLISHPPFSQDSSMKLKVTPPLCESLMFAINTLWTLSDNGK